ncbi:DUF58 domain-containing protein [Cellvibrio fibrivorans]|uniref:Uncharacterized protein (DUF58 family) n=1 Tax=Cellvibrio fibrivorans TaxID=126350 RepID=A0ABU1V2B8_9GAMM|nr:DUF58 domain-containing protein [Cellvibrio fibrivorans]MDR7091604.1 uncharacterized protein (DUF58 family) [Cellvibrio fibrivorans]
MASLITSLRNAWETRFYRWIDQRSPRARQVQLNRKNLYTFPNLTGLLYTAITLVIWLLGTNYQNNLILALSYLLVSIFVVSILHAFANLAGISIRFVGARPAFAGDPAALVLELNCINKAGCDNLELRWPGGETQVITLNHNEPQQVIVRAQSVQRGYLRPGRLLVQSRFPLGIIRCWTWLNLDASALIYPAPIFTDEPHAQASNGREEGGTSQRGGDDFSGLRDYQAGDPIKHIAWKQFAQDKGLFTKEYEAYLSAEKWLDWDSLNHPQELRLSGLCYWALDYERRQIPYGLRLPGLNLAPALGEHHQQAVLTALGEFNLPREAKHAR